MKTTDAEFTTTGVASSQKARLVVKDPSSIGSEGLISVLNSTGGVIFPYTPTIMTSHSVNYGSYDLPHSVAQSMYYVNTPNPTISITATFTANSQQEAVYSAACLHFFKTMTKTDFGRGAKARGTAGAPPPVMMFSAYGASHFKNVPVVIGNFSYSLVEDHDYVTFSSNRHGMISMPTMWTASIELLVQIAPIKQKDFNLTNYTSGKLLNKGGWI